MPVDPLKYLSYYGYLDESTGAALQDGAKSATINLVPSLIELQRRGGIPQTGELDDATRQLMARPRCAVRDIQRLMAGPEFARWRKTSLTLYVSRYVEGPSTSKQDQNIEQMCKLWRDASGKRLRLTRIESPMADLILSTGRGSQANFDGPGATLAWAYLPNGTDNQLLMRFDEDEGWDPEMHLGVLNHEAGHLIGLTHSENHKDLMAPFFSRQILTPQDGDKRRVQILYLGSPELPDANPPVTPPPIIPPSPQPPGVFPMEPLLNAVRQILAFFRGTDKSLRKLVKAVGTLATLVSEYLPDASMLIAKPLSDDQAIGYLESVETAATSEAQAALNIPWVLILKWLFTKLASL